MYLQQEIQTVNAIAARLLTVGVPRMMETEGSVVRDRNISSGSIAAIFDWTKSAIASVFRSIFRYPRYLAAANELDQLDSFFLADIDLVPGEIRQALERSRKVASANPPVGTLDGTLKATVANDGDRQQVADAVQQL